MDRFVEDAGERCRRRWKTVQENRFIENGPLGETTADKEAAGEDSMD